jgi:hypothetical protein
VGLLALLGWPGIFSWEALVISSNSLMIIYSGIVFDCHLVFTPLVVFLFMSFLAGAKRKRRRKERKKMCSF